MISVGLPCLSRKEASRITFRGTPYCNAMLITVAAVQQIA